MKLKLIASVLVLMVALTGVLGATAAYFSDTEASLTTVTAGTLDLTVGDAQKWDIAFTNFKPGDSEKDSMIVTNVGTVNGFLKAKLNIFTVEDIENWAIEPEIEAGDTNDNAIGELSKELWLTIKAKVNTSATAKATIEEVVLFDGSLSDLTTEELSKGILPIDFISLGAGQSATITVTASWSNYLFVPGYGINHNDNRAQGDTCKVPIAFELYQA